MPCFGVAILDLAALVSFNHVARHGGIAEASRATGQPKSTLSRHVRDLEVSLGIRLLERGRRSAILTKEGLLLRARTETLLSDVEEAAHAVASSCKPLKGPLRVSVPVFFANVSMGSIAAAFREKYPEVELEIFAEDRIVDLIADNRDVAIRVRPRLDETLVGRCFFRTQHVIVAPLHLQFPVDVDESGPGLVPAVVLTGEGSLNPWHLSRGGRTLTLRPEPVLRVSALMTARDAVCAGAGAARLPLSLVEQDITAGRLSYWGNDPSGETELWVLHASRRLPSAKVSAFVQFLCAYHATSERNHPPDFRSTAGSEPVEDRS